MAIHTKKSCPHCNKVYESYSYYPGNRTKHIGSPFLTCNYCGELFVDIDIEEPALNEYDKNAFSIFKCLFSTLFPWGIGSISFTWLMILCETTFEYYFLCWGITIFLDLTYIYLLVNLLKNRKKYQTEYLMEYKASEKRLSNPDYANAIQRLGFNVPNRFFSDVKTNVDKNLLHGFKRDNSNDKLENYDFYNKLLKHCDSTIREFRNESSDSPISSFIDLDFVSSELATVLYSLIKYKLNSTKTINLEKYFCKHYRIAPEHLDSNFNFYSGILYGKDFLPGYSCLSSSGIANTEFEKCFVAFCDIIINPNSKNSTEPFYDSIYSPPINSISYSLFYSRILAPILKTFLLILTELGSQF